MYMDQFHLQKPSKISAMYEPFKNASQAAKTIIEVLYFEVIFIKAYWEKN